MSKAVIRRAQVSDVPEIERLLENYSQQGIILPRSSSELYNQLPHFFVALLDNQTVGCASLEIFTAELAEVRSLAIEPAHKGQQLGRQLVDAVEAYARELGIKKMMALTYVDQFFHKLGYHTVMMTEFPEKVWGVCVKCPKFHHCDEIPVLKHL